MIRIPYFVQLDRAGINYFFGKDISNFLDYPHGFISDTCMLPADFNAMGINRYITELSEFPAEIRESIEFSLCVKAEELGELLTYF